MRIHWKAALKIITLLSSFYYHELEHPTEHVHPEKVKIEKKHHDDRPAVQHTHRKTG